MAHDNAGSYWQQQHCCPFIPYSWYVTVSVIKFILHLCRTVLHKHSFKRNGIFELPKLNDKLFMIYGINCRSLRGCYFSGDKAMTHILEETGLTAVVSQNSK